MTKKNETIFEKSENSFNYCKSLINETSILWLVGRYTEEREKGENR